MRAMFSSLRTVAIAALAAGSVLVATPVAHADWRGGGGGGWHGGGGGGWHGGGWNGGGWNGGGWRGGGAGCCWRGGVFIGVAPPIYAPPPVYYAPPAYYYPPPYAYYGY